MSASRGPPLTVALNHELARQPPRVCPAIDRPPSPIARISQRKKLKIVDFFSKLMVQLF
jgi:hypothetical protein